jgi:hypothetical protein
MDSTPGKIPAGVITKEEEEEGRANGVSRHNVRVTLTNLQTPPNSIVVCKDERYDQLIPDPTGREGHEVCSESDHSRGCTKVSPELLSPQLLYRWVSKCIPRQGKVPS